ncbi:MAG: hypothetical protein HC769_32280 [Cyanobacteria bacterium CRU_2_1]|nr:hypothetical protein [Cyanobacteria bacterium RU_5_0]NJR63057.1 hypothetical protein [Cyanobacteria bacterium CRU_2_1]
MSFKADLLNQCLHRIGSQFHLFCNALVLTSSVGLFQMQLPPTDTTVSTQLSKQLPKQLNAIQRSHNLSCQPESLILTPQSAMDEWRKNGVTQPNVQVAHAPVIIDASILRRA